MRWQECNQMDERLKFIAGLLDGEKMAALCRQFGVSRRFSSSPRQPPTHSLLPS
jgi:hypothetical protein